MTINQIDEVLYIDIEDQHPDTMRFVLDCQEWFGKQITILKSPLASVENACLQAGGKGYINGVYGATCTKQLKKMVRLKWEYEQNLDIHLKYIWGMDFKEKDRANRLIEAFPEHDHIFPLIENKMSKARVHQMLTASGIKRPAMYDLGYLNNNCIGCVKGGMGYWNKIRVDFPDVFKSRAEMERKIGASCMNGQYLDELEPNKGRKDKPIVADCGIFCDLLVIK